MCDTDSIELRERLCFTELFLHHLLLILFFSVKVSSVQLSDMLYCMSSISASVSVDIQNSFHLFPRLIITNIRWYFFLVNDFISLLSALVIMLFVFIHSYDVMLVLL